MKNLLTTLLVFYSTLIFSQLELVYHPRFVGDDITFTLTLPDGVSLATHDVMVYEARALNNVYAESVVYWISCNSNLNLDEPLVFTTTMENSSWHYCYRPKILLQPCDGGSGWIKGNEVYICIPCQLVIDSLILELHFKCDSLENCEQEVITLQDEIIVWRDSVTVLNEELEDCEDVTTFEVDETCLIVVAECNLDQQLCIIRVNPTIVVDLINVQVETSLPVTDFRVQISDVFGNILFEYFGDYQEFTTFDASTLPSGFYSATVFMNLDGVYYEFEPRKFVKK